MVHIRSLLLPALVFVGFVFTNGTTFCAEKKPVDSASQSGPATEQRFPKLVVPDGFKATLFACDPLIEYPSVIALGPKPQTLFVAHDYMTGLGVEIVRRDEIRIIQDSDDDGYANKSIVYAKGFNSVQGLAYHAGWVYVMHAPFLTSLRDTDDDGVADERRDLLKGLGLPPEENDNRLHCANGVVVGHDGWLYLALGDRGCDVKRPEGDRLLFQQGGILRCRPDGRDLHVFSTGLRNIYDIALDEELNVFVRDNENDGGDYMIRVCHCFHGSDHGYPYHYYERPDEAMPPLADLGRGSSAGITAYLESAFPTEFRESLFCCEWGRAIVRYHCEREGSTFAPMTEVDFAAGAPDDPYGFKPTDLVVDRDGSLLISDWADGQRPKRARGRIYRVTYTGSATEKAGAKDLVTPEEKTLNDWISQLSSTSYYSRVEAQNAIELLGDDGYSALLRAIKRGQVTAVGRLHAVWILAHIKGDEAIDDLFELVGIDGDPHLRAQAVRAIADLTDPILTKHRLDAGRGDVEMAERLAGLRADRDSRLMLEVVIALGRLKWSGAPTWLYRWMKRKPDPAVNHAAAQTIRRAGNWDEVFNLLLDDPFGGVRPAALTAVAEQADTQIVNRLLERLNGDYPWHRRAEYADLLARVYKKPADWQYWGFRPANSVKWERTDAIENALDGGLHDPDHKVRVSALSRMMREEVPIKLDSLTDWLKEEREPDRVAAIIESLEKRQFDEIRDVLKEVILSPTYNDDNRLSALKLLVDRLTEPNESLLMTLAKTVNDGPVLAELLNEIGGHGRLDSDRLLLEKLDSPSGDVRAAAITSLANQGVQDAAPRVTKLLDDKLVEVRRAAASAAGMLGARDTGPRLLEMASDSDRQLCRASLESLAELNFPGALPAAVKGLDHPDTQLAALSYLERQGGPAQLDVVKKLAEANRSSDILSSIVRAISRWERTPKHQLKLYRAIAEIQGQTGALICWTTVGPISSDDAERLGAEATQRKAYETIPFEPEVRQTRFASGTDAQINFATKDTITKDVHCLAIAHLYSAESSEVEFLASSNGSLQVWHNDLSIFNREKTTKYHPNTDRFDTVLPSGASQLLVRISGTDEIPRFHLRFRRKSSQAEHERLTKLALAGGGNANRGREVFFNTERSQCAKCHRIGQEGGRIGPDLSGTGSRFSRIHLIESILQPSRTVAPSYGTLSLALSDGRVLSGVKTLEDNKTLTIGDNQGKAHTIPKSKIEEVVLQQKSTMSDGLEKRLTDREFIDLIAFLISQKK